MKPTNTSATRVSTTALYASVIAGALALSGSSAFAAATASDNAANYVGTWGTSPANNGTGFDAWSITLNNANNPPYVGTYLDQSSPVTTGGYSWGTYANQGPNDGSIAISRPFTADVNGSSSLDNQTFSVNLSSQGVGNGSGGPPNSELQVGVGNAFSFSYLGTGSDNFLLSIDGGAPVSTPVGFSALSAGIQISLAVSGPLNSSSENYTFAVSPVSGGSPIFSQSGTFDSSSFNTAGFNYLDQNTTGNGYFNDLAVTTSVPLPEPSTYALFGASALVLWRRFKKS